MPEGNRLGEKIARLRRARNMTQAELAEKLHFTYQAVSNWERGVSEPNAETLVALAAFFDTTADELLKGENPASADEGEGEAEQCAEEKVKISAPQALRIALWIYAGLRLLLLIFPFEVSLAAIYIGGGIGLLADLVLFVAFILFFFSKQIAPRPAAWVCFFISACTAAVLCVLINFLQGQGLLISQMLFYGFSLLSALLLPLCFRARDAALRRAVYLLFASLLLYAALTYASRTSWYVYEFMTAASNILYVAALFLLEASLCGRPEYAGEASSAAEGAAPCLAEKERTPAFRGRFFPSGTFTGMFLLSMFGCGVFLLSSTNPEDPSGVENWASILLWLFPALFELLFFIGKSAKRPAVKTAAAILWAVNVLYILFVFLADMIFDYEPHIITGCVNSVLWFVLYAAVLFGFRGRGRGKGIVPRCVLLFFALVAAGLGVFLCAGSSNEQGAALVELFAFWLLFYPAHFLIKDRTEKKKESA